MAASSSTIGWQTTTQSVFHPKHSLTLVNNKRAVNHPIIECDLCSGLVQGLSYTCRACNFDAHPVCTQLPPSVLLPIHPHRLRLMPGKLVSCDLCCEDCTSWRYRCTACLLDIHLECALGYDDDDDDDDDDYYDEIVVYGGGCYSGMDDGYPPPPMMMMANNQYHQPPPMTMMANNHYHQPPPMMMANNQYHQPLPMMMMANNQYHQPPPMMMANNHQARSIMPTANMARGQTSSGSKRKKLFKILGRVAISALTTSVIGVPLSF